MSGFMRNGRRVPRLLLWSAAIVYAAAGAAFALAPVTLAGWMDIALPTPTARIEFAATYGGLELGIAAFLAYCALRRERVRIGLVAGGCATAGFAITRAGALLAAGPGRPVLWAMLLLEALGAGLCFRAAQMTSRAEAERRG